MSLANINEGDYKIFDKGLFRVSPYVSLVHKAIDYGDRVEYFHGITGNDYVCCLPITNDEKILCVRQYRPMIEKFTWELPAGTVEKDETPLEAAKRELLEETGYLTKNNPIPMGAFYADTGRLDIKADGFLFNNLKCETTVDAEEILEVRGFSYTEIIKMIISGNFHHPMHATYVLLYLLNQGIDFKGKINF